VTSSWSFILQ